MQLLKPFWIAKEGQPIFSIDIHPDGSRFATGGQGGEGAGRISIWNMKPVLSADADESVPKLLAQMDHHLGCVNCLRWSHSGKMLASGGDDKLVMIWKKSNYGAGGTIFGGGGKVNVESWRCCHTLRSHDGDILDLAWAPGDKLLATASIDNTIIIWNGDSLPDIVRTLRGHTGMVKGVVFDPVGKYLASQSDDKTLRVWKTSDWTEESIITDPFKESGGTTTVLRPGWSPDGSLLVSAHAMNEGGPTAQIIERADWSTKRDFVGHKKAVSCVRFNPNLLSKTNEKGGTEYFVTLAIGSRDRSFSLWSTNLKRPYLVMNDVFDQTVLDLSWSSDGKILMACSMDGSVAVVILKEKELGKPVSEAKFHDMMSRTYGKNFSLPSAPKKAPTNGTIIAENPNFLQAKSTSEMINGTSNENGAIKARPKGPTKQIEARTSDGKRRITPIFIPIEDEKDSSQNFGSTAFGSTSTQEKSTIEVEKRDDIVHPNVSPGKGGDGGKANMGEKDAKKEPNEKEKEDDDVLKKSKKIKRVLSSSEDESDDEDDDKNKQKQESKNEKVNLIVVRKTKSRDQMTPGPSLVTAKRIVPSEDGDESPRPKKRGRPPMNRASPVRSTSPVKPPPSVVTNTANGSERVVPATMIISDMEGKAVLPTLQIEKTKGYSFLLKDRTLSVQVANFQHTLPSGSHLHLLKFKYSSDLTKEGLCQILLSAAVNSVNLCSDFVVATCLDSSLHVFNTVGERVLPPLMLPSPVSKIHVQDDNLVAVTTTGKFFQWQFTNVGPKVIQKDQCILSLLQSHNSQASVRISRLSIDKFGHPVIITNVGKSYMFLPDFGTWTKLSDANDTLFYVSSYSGAQGAAQHPSDQSLPLNSLSKITAKKTSVVEDADLTIRSLANVSYSELQSVSAKFLNSQKEYKYWMLQKVRHLVEDSEAAKLREMLDSLSRTAEEDQELMGIRKSELYDEVLKMIGTNASLQRLFMEYQDQTQSKSDLNELDSHFMNQLMDTS